jgi:GntR family transcriptional regulator
VADAAAATRAIDPKSDRPVYKQIADVLRQQIDDGDLAPGDRLPSETALMQQFGTARATVRNALELLASEGRTRSVRGKGVFVRERSATSISVVRQTHDRLERRYREAGHAPLDVDALASGLPLVQNVYELAELPAPDHIANRLNTSSGDMVFVRRRRVDLQGGAPLQLADSYIPLDLAEGQIREVDSGPGGTYARIEEQGHHLTRFTEELTFRMPTDDEARRLRLDHGVPVIDLVRVAHAGERPVECFVAVMAGDKHRFTYRIDADDE